MVSRAVFGNPPRTRSNRTIQWGAVKAAQQAENSVEEATASIDLDAKYKDYTNERYRAAVQAIDDGLKSQPR